MKLLVALMAAQATVLAPPQDVVPRWVEPPTFTAEDYPPLADLLGMEATVRLRCIANPDGAVTQCVALNLVGHARYGFEGAAMHVVQRGRVVPHVENGQPATYSFEINVPFRARSAEDIERYAGPEPSAYFLDEMDETVSDGISDDGYEWSFFMDDLTRQDQAKVRPYIAQAYEGFRAEWRRALVLAYAREAKQQGVMRASNWRLPRRTGSPAYDQLNLVELQIRDRARDLFCADNPCP